MDKTIEYYKVIEALLIAKGFDFLVEKREALYGFIVTNYGNLGANEKVYLGVSGRVVSIHAYVTENNLENAEKRIQVVDKLNELNQISSFTKFVLDNNNRVYLESTFLLFGDIKDVANHVSEMFLIFNQELDERTSEILQLINNKE